jgi:hypothetical protein
MWTASASSVVIPVSSVMEEKVCCAEEYVPESLRTARDRLGGGASNDVMAYYLVRAKPKPERLGELQNRLQEDAFIDLRPFGKALTRSLKEARTQSDGFAIWEEEDYCSPPLAEERAAVLDKYFDEISVERVNAGEGWNRITTLPRLNSNR